MSCYFIPSINTYNTIQHHTPYTKSTTNFNKTNIPPNNHKQQMCKTNKQNKYTDDKQTPNKLQNKQKLNTKPKNKPSKPRHTTKFKRQITQIHQKQNNTLIFNNTHKPHQKR